MVLVSIILGCVAVFLRLLILARVLPEYCAEMEIKKRCRAVRLWFCRACAILTPS